MQQGAARYLPVIRRKSQRTTVYDIGRVVEPDVNPVCPVCGREILLLAFDDAGPGMVWPFDPAPDGEPGHRFDDLLPTPHVCVKDRTDERASSD